MAASISEFTSELERDSEAISQVENLRQASLRVSLLGVTTGFRGIQQTHTLGLTTVGLGVLGLGLAIALHNNLKSLGQRIGNIEKSLGNNGQDKLSDV
ncbi:hypothetical protein ACFLX1_01920 [Chloroflexota bacterium]